MWAHSQPVLFSFFKPSLLSHGQSSISKNKDPSPWSLWTTPMPLISSIPLKLSDQPVLLSSGPISLKQIRAQIASGVCKYIYVQNPFCYWSWWSSKTGMWSCDKDDNKAVEAIEIAHIVYFLTGNPHTSDFTRRFWPRHTSLHPAKRSLTCLNCWHFVEMKINLRFPIVSPLT